MDIVGNETKKKFRKQIAQDRLYYSRVRGSTAEQTFRAAHSVRGNDIERTGRGHDFKVRERDFITGKPKGRSYYAEVKSSDTAPLSQLQKKMQKRLKGRYKVVRSSVDW